MEAPDRAQNARTTSERQHERKAALISADPTNNVVCCATGSHAAAFVFSAQSRSGGGGALCSGPVCEVETSSPILAMHASHGYIVAGTTDKRVYILRAVASSADAQAASYEQVSVFDVPKKASAISIVSVSDRVLKGGSGSSRAAETGASKLYLLIADKFADVYCMSLDGVPPAAAACRRGACVAAAPRANAA